MSNLTGQKIELELDVQATIRNINESIDRIKGQLKTVKVDAQIANLNEIENLENRLRNLTVSPRLEVDRNSLLQLQADVQNVLNNLSLNISNINVGQTQTNYANIGNQINNSIAQGITENRNVILQATDEAIRNVSSREIRVPFKVDIVGSRTVQEEIENEIKKLQAEEKTVTKFQVTTNTVYDEQAKRNVEELTGAVVNYTTKTGEAIRETLRWGQIGVDKNGNPIAGWVQGVTTYTQRLNESSSKTQAFFDRQTTAINNYETELAKITSRLNDTNAPRTLANTDFNANGLNAQIVNVENAIANLRNSTSQTFAQNKADVESEISALNNLITTLKNAEYVATSLRTKDINTIRDEELNKLDAFISKMQKSGYYTDELRNDFNSLRTSLTNVGNSSDLTNYLNQLSVLQARFKAIESEGKRISEKGLLDLKKEKLVSDIKTIMKTFSKEIDKSGISTKFNKLLADVNFASSNDQLRILRQQLATLRSELKLTSTTGVGLGETLKKAFGTLTPLLGMYGTYGALMQVRNVMNQAYNEALKLDTELTNLSRVSSDITRDNFPSYLDKCVEKSKDLAVSVEDYINALTTFSRSGYNLADAEVLADYSTMLSKVGDMTEDISSKALLAGLQAYDEIGGYTMENLSKKTESLIDKIDKLGNVASISQSDLAEAITVTGSVMASSNTSIDKFLAMLSGGNRAIQNVNSLALGLRTFALRLRGSKVDLKNFNEETDGVIESIPKLRSKIMALTAINGTKGVDILEVDGKTFKDIYEIAKEISKVYDDLDDTNKAALLELVAGKQRSNQVEAILKNFDEIENLLGESLNSSGTALKEYEVYLDSAEAATNRFQVAVTSIYSNIFNGESVKGIANLGTSILELVDNLSLIQGTFSGLATFGLLKFFTSLTLAIKTTAFQMSQFGNALGTVKSLTNLQQGTTQYTQALDRLTTSCKGLTQNQINLLLSTKGLTEAQKVAILQTTGLTEAEAKQRLVELGLVGSNNLLTSSTFSLKNAIVGVGASIKSAFLTNPIGMAILAISTVVGVVTSAIDSYNQSLEENRQATSELAKKDKEVYNTLDDLIEKYKELKQEESYEGENTDKILDVQSEIRDVIGEQADGIDLVNGKLDEQLSKLADISNENLKNAISTAETDMLLKQDEIAKNGKGASSLFWGNLSPEIQQLHSVGISTRVKKKVTSPDGVEGVAEFDILDANTIEDDVKILEDWLNQLNKAKREGKDVSLALGWVSKKYSEYSDKVNEANQATSDYNDLVAKSVLNKNFNIIDIKTVEDYENIIDEINNSNGFNGFENTNLTLEEQKNKLIELIQKYLPDYAKEVKQIKSINNDEETFDKTFSNLQDEIKNIQALQTTLQNFNNDAEFNTSDLDNLIKAYPELTTEVQKYYAGETSAQDLFNTLTTKETEYVNKYKDDMRMLSAINNETLQNWAKANDEDLSQFSNIQDLKDEVFNNALDGLVEQTGQTVDDLKKLYKEDFDNFIEFEKQKLIESYWKKTNDLNDRYKSNEITKDERDEQWREVRDNHYYNMHQLDVMKEANEVQNQQPTVLDKKKNTKTENKDKTKYNSSYRNRYDEQIKDLEYGLKNFTKAQDRYDDQFDKALEKGNNDLAQSYADKAKQNAENYKKSAQNGLNRINGIQKSVLGDLGKLDNRFRGKTADQILGNSGLAETIRQENESEILRLENNNENGQYNARIAALNQENNAISSLLGTLSTTVDKQEEFNNILNDVDTTGLEKTEKLYDSIISKNDSKIKLLAKQDGTEDEQISLVQSNIAETEKMIAKLRQLGYQEGSKEIQGYKDAIEDSKDQIRDIKEKAYDTKIRQNNFKISLLEDKQNTGDERIKIVQENTDYAHKMAEWYRSQGYSEGSEEIQGYQEAYLDGLKQIRDIKKAEFEKKETDINFKINLLSDKQGTVEDRLKLVKELMQNDHNTAEYWRQQGYEEGSEEIQGAIEGYNSHYKDYIALKEELLSENNDILQNRIDILDLDRGNENEIKKLYEEQAKNAHELADWYRSQIDADGNRIFGEDSPEITALQKAYRESMQNARDVVKEAFQNTISDIEDSIEDINFEIDIVMSGEQTDRFIQRADLINQQLDLEKEKMFKLGNAIAKLNEEYENDQSNKEYIENLKDLEKQYRQSEKSVNDYYKSLRDNAKEELDIASDVQETIVDMLEDKYKQQADIYKDMIEQEKKYIDNRKKLLDDLLAAYEKIWKAEDEDEKRQNKLKDRNKLADKRNSLSNAAASGDLEALSKMEDLNEDIANLDAELADDSKESYRQSVRDRIDEEKRHLEDLSESYDKDLELYNKALDEKLKKKNLYAEADRILETGLFEDAYGNITSLGDAYGNFIDETSNGFGILGNQIKTEFIDKLIDAKDILSRLPDLLAENGMSIRKYLETLGYDVDWNNDTKEIIVNGKKASSKDFGWLTNDRVTATTPMINELLDFLGLAKTGIKSKQTMEVDAKTGSQSDVNDIDIEHNTKSQRQGVVKTVEKVVEKFGDGTTKVLTKISKNLSNVNTSGEFKNSNIDNNNWINANDFVSNPNIFTNALNSSCVGDMANNISQIKDNIIKNIETVNKPPVINVDGSVTVQGNLDNVTKKELENYIATNTKTIAQNVAKVFNGTLSNNGTVGRIMR